MTLPKIALTVGDVFDDAVGRSGRHNNHFRRKARTTQLYGRDQGIIQESTLLCR